MEISVGRVEILPDPLNITKTNAFFEALENEEIEF